MQFFIIKHKANNNNNIVKIIVQMNKMTTKKWLMKIVIKVIF